MRPSRGGHAARLLPEVAAVARACLALLVIVVSIKAASTQAHVFLGLSILLLGAVASGLLLRPWVTRRHKRE